MSIYISYDVIGEQIIDSFVRKNDKSAIRDFVNAFKQQARDDSEVQLFRVALLEDNTSNVYPVEIDSIPCYKIWSSSELEKNDD